MDSVNSADRFDQHLRLVLEPVRRYLARRTDPATADDVLGDTLLVLWRRASDIPADEADAVPWAIGIARFQLANAERSARRQRRLFARIVAVDRPEAVVDAHHEQAGEGRGGWGGGGDDVERVRSALTALRPADAEILRLAVWEELALRRSRPCSTSRRTRRASVCIGPGSGCARNSSASERPRAHPDMTG